MGAVGVARAAAMFDPNRSTAILGQMKGVVLIDGIGTHVPFVADIPEEKSRPRS
jgi:hypothetical protein